MKVKFLVKVFSTDEVEWNKYIQKLPVKMQDIYYTSEYYKIQEVNGDGIARIFIYEEDDKLACYPFLMNEIVGYELEEKCYDIETAYGYGGPTVSSCDDRFLERFEKAFDEYCSKNNIVAEFIRFHPLLKNENIFKKDIKVIHNRTTVCLKLEELEEDLWKTQIISKNRNVIRKAEKCGLTVEFEEDLESFIKIYEETMDKVNAGEYYYFSKEYYKCLEDLDNTYISIKFEEKIIATAIFMKHGDYFHYHLAGSLKEYLKYSPNNLLLWSAIKYANENGYKIMHFGGGLSDSLDDNLFKFKKSFSKDTCDFYIGKRVHNEVIYKYIINEWEAKNNKKANLFLQYKM